MALLRAELRQPLPQSYGLGSGRLCNERQQLSSRVDLVLYDRTIESMLMREEEGIFDIRQALVTVQLADALDTVGLEALLRVTASTKTLLPERKLEEILATQRPARRLGKFLPLGIIAFRALKDTQTQSQEVLVLLLDASLKRQKMLSLPDFLLAQGHGLLYRNPVLDRIPFAQSTIHISRTLESDKAYTCYVCKRNYTHHHFFYERLCLQCGDLNYVKRAIPGDLTGRIALVTGARIKIGYATALRLLRAGARVIATTRFPYDAARRYSREPDFQKWRDRLHIYGLDFRSLPVLEQFINYLSSAYPGLDILINNAAQTVKQPPSAYAALLASERAELSAEQRLLVERSQAMLPPVAFMMQDGEEPFRALLAPPGSSAKEAPPVAQEEVGPLAVAEQNSWTARLADISLAEMLEVQVVNVTAPFLLISRLRPLMKRSQFPHRFIVNVTATEGQFAQKKRGTHPHTNMAKAALNMLTHSSAEELAADSLYMNSVDPGWISLQTPVDIQDEHLILPLDLVDAAARVCDPIFQGIVDGKLTYGHFYKDYVSVPW
ncbi:short subunit dehydrogenase [Thermosporothrix hazakensis]|uniref:Short subunit dehydrogenase n=1 Tax=Thermosporothrix hazakensis TaxID=644383 RepID=A0A326UNZ9_THEHA|nr:SDR family NAD(P)-dependent oxidoreductase [Thermosporothrix hazakensis]PZW31982.1 short subunit dehydrogenase [Thermosporothrix hazakensis]GCE49692.1 hypothetical protein KTH_45610 [Thermosporothrix hazakensis]